MIVVVNGEETEVNDGAAVSEVIAALGLRPERVAVELNHKIVRRADWGSTALGEGDRVEIVHFVGGGETSIASDGPITDQQVEEFKCPIHLL
jgi:thiamine biosynthesis protein ThiS